MQPQILLIGGAALAVYFLTTKTAQGQQVLQNVTSVMVAPDVKYSNLDGVFKKYAQLYKLDWLLLKAIATVESSLNPQAENPADPSVGLMQILCVPDGCGSCSNKFNVDGWPPPFKEALFDADYNVKIGSQILAWNIKTYGNKRGIAVYNSWSARNDPPEGPFRNQSYVDKVVSAYAKLGGKL